ncbi:hypothetical protein B0H66DRAFT_618834 [Apodospora peruviana]|uniref:VWFA domain-containing protein n=1 Tax=Apodospora peruviana TaxID=516989 RepID=A0AAE0IB32_9PEZI|nr:hypothetical protein B0H66DRAFT_618834 [Apodospora peruviana]
MSLQTPCAVTSSVRCLVLAANLHPNANPYGQHYTMRSPSWAKFMASKPVKLRGRSEFDQLLIDTNASRAFRMVNPLKVGGACLSADLPVITMDGKGFVSLYGQEDQGFGERRFYIWNCVAGKTVYNNLGQQISTSLQPVIEARKKEQKWEVDAWTEWTEVDSHGPPDEPIVICVDMSMSMDSEMDETWNPPQLISGSESDSGMKPSRLHDVKDFFNSFSTRLCAYNLSTHTGLVTFSSTSKVVQLLTALQTQSTQKLNNITARHRTAIFDALDDACDMLVEQKTKSPNTKCRIVLLTDGNR